MPYTFDKGKAFIMIMATQYMYKLTPFKCAPISQ